MAWPMRSAPSASGSPLLPICATIAGIALFSVMDAVMKRAAIAGGVYPVLLVRSAIGAALLAPVWLLRAGRWPERAVLRLHLLRSALVAGMAATFFWGLVRMPLADAIALSFVAPLLALWLAAALLRETVRPAAFAASALGFAGVVVIVAGRGARTDQGADWPATAAILVSAALYAGNIVVQRRQAQVASPLEVALFQNAGVMLFLLPAWPWLWHMPPPDALCRSAVAALLASASLMLISWAYARAETQVLVPIEYSAFAWAALMGWLWFGERVTAATLGGVALIVGSVWLTGRAAGKPPRQGAEGG